MPIPNAVNNQNQNNYNFTIDQFKAAFEQAQQSGGYVYINKQGNLAVRGAFANFFGIGGIDNSKQKTLEAFQSALENSVKNIDIFTDHNQTTIKKGSGLSADMMSKTFAYANIKQSQNKRAWYTELNDIKDDLTKEYLYPKIKLNKGIMDFFFDRINSSKDFRNMHIEDQVDLVKNAMLTINDKFIPSLHANGYETALNTIRNDNTIRGDVKELLGVEDPNINFLATVRNQNEFEELNLKTDGLTDNLKKLFLDKINNTNNFKNLNFDSKVALIKNAMQTINDNFIKDLDKNGYETALNNFVNNQNVSQDVRTLLLDAQNLKSNILETVHKQHFELDNKLNELKDTVFSSKQEGGNQIKLTDDLKEAFLKKINSNLLLKNLDVDSKVTLIKNTLKIINDEINIGDLNDDGYNEVELRILLTSGKTSLNEKILLGIQEESNAILAKAKRQFNEVRGIVDLTLLTEEELGIQKDDENKFQLMKTVKEGFIDKINNDKRFENLTASSKIKLLKDAIKVINTFTQYLQQDNTYAAAQGRTFGNNNISNDVMILIDGSNPNGLLKEIADQYNGISNKNNLSDDDISRSNSQDGEVVFKEDLTSVMNEFKAKKK